MIVNISDIKLLQFGVVDLNYKCDLPKNIDIASIAEELVIDLEYDFLKIEQSKNVFQISLRLKLFPPEKMFGYNLTLRPIGFFELPDNWNKEIIDNALIFTCVPLLLGYARAFIAEITSNFPYGKYLLPAISMESISAANKNRKVKNQ